MIMKELTKWKDSNTPNHIYDIQGDRITRYRPVNRGRWIELAKPLRFDVRRRKFLEVDEDYIEEVKETKVSNESNSAAPAKTKEKKVSKVDLAADIVRANPKATRAELIVMFMQELSMSKAGASTYVQLARKRVAG